MTVARDSKIEPSSTAFQDIHWQETGIRQRAKHCDLGCKCPKQHFNHSGKNYPNSLFLLILQQLLLVHFYVSLTYNLVGCVQMTHLRHFIKCALRLKNRISPTSLCFIRRMYSPNSVRFVISNSLRQGSAKTKKEEL